MQAFVFANRARDELEQGTPARVRASELIAVAEPTPQEIREWNRAERSGGRLSCTRRLAQHQSHRENSMRLLIGLLAASLFTACTAAHEEPEAAGNEAIEAIVHRYIVENPEVIERWLSCNAVPARASRHSLSQAPSSSGTRSMATRLIRSSARRTPN